MIRTVLLLDDVERASDVFKTFTYFLMSPLCNQIFAGELAIPGCVEIFSMFNNVPHAQHIDHCEQGHS